MLSFFSRHRWRLIRRKVQHLDLRRTVLRAGVYLSTVLVLHTVAMVVFEEIKPSDALWLTLTTVVTVGYGDLSATTTWGRVATVILIYFGAIFVMFQSAADYFESRSEKKRRMLKGQWVWNMRDHVLVLNSPSINPVQYFKRMVDELRVTRYFQDCSVQIITTRFAGELPEVLHKRGVVHYNGYPGDPEILQGAGVRHAKTIIILARQEDNLRSDADTFDLLHRLTELDTRATVLVEAVGDGNIERLRQAGADIVVRPIRFYPEIVVRALVSPGADQILSNLFTCCGDEVVRFDIPVTGWRWAELAHKLMVADIGTAIAFMGDTERHIRCNPAPDSVVSASALFVIVREGNLPSTEKICHLLNVSQ